MRCSKCGKEMTDEKGNTFAMLEITIRPDKEAEEDFGMSKEFMQKQLGKYQLDKKFSFCCECYLDMCFMGKYGEAPNEI